MKKFNGFEGYLLKQGLAMVLEEMKKDIREIESKGKSPMMTEGYVDMVGKETLDKLQNLIIKHK